ncbi:uncharacterized protein LV89_00783 [Arcicella aurantiaca]|uniref:DUF418 domain-containing protein n=1 Tax=Arcicella aurantiaca TaxID=591202 RepID=A0A316EDB4_9BACT|nr:DUF418 domain-containing protein [Arcicella aurantiaca]PWK28579.1 uncharacterized protein LV89_00783 [Arcicella aurantiaca]
MKNALVAPKERIFLIDGLRGFALLGIILAHIGGWFIAGGIPATVWQKYQNDVGTAIANYFGGIFIDGKFYTLFSFLFGLSFAIQLLQRKDDDTRFIQRFMWRLVILFIIGFVHHIHWKGDILGIYAVLGFIMILFRNVGNKVLWIGILFFILNMPVIIRDVVQKTQPKEKPKTEKEQELEVEKYEKETVDSYNTLKKGTYLDVVAQNFRDFKSKADFQFSSGRIYITLGFFLLGLWVGKKRFFENFEKYKPLFKKIMWLSLIANIFIVAFFITVEQLKLWEKLGDWMNIIANTLYAIHCVMMTLLYLTGISLLLNLKSMSWILDKFASVGKMGLTNYLLQSVIGVMLFYGIGFGLAGEFNADWCYLIGIGIFILQIIFSKWWLSKFNYGPMEWLWRSATYLKWQPMQK